jgi:tetratricopeptide (TPR) repeat protein
VYLFKRLINTGVNSNAIQQALAWSLYQMYQYTEALNVINALLEIYETPNLLQTKACILAEYGFSDQDKGKIIQARNLFRKFSEETGDSLMYFNYGNTLNELGDGHEAIKQYKISLNLNPNNAQCWKNLGTTYYGIGEHDQEIICYDTALSLDSDLPQALFSKGITLAQHYGKYEEALSLFHKVLDRKNTLIQGYVNGLFWVAYCYQEIGDLTLAGYSAA